MSSKAIVAQFFVRAFEKYANGVGYAAPAPRIQVRMSVVSGNRAPENQKWASATPQGEITMTIGNPEAAAWFEEMLGEDIEVTFRARPKEED